MEPTSYAVYVVRRGRFPLPHWHEIGGRLLAFRCRRIYNGNGPLGEQRVPVLWQLMERSVTLSMEDRGQQVSTDAAPATVEPTVAAEPMSLMQELLSNPSHDYRALKYGDVIDGVIMQRDRDEFLVDIGSKSEGIIPSREITLSTDEADLIKVGDQVLVFVVQAENADGHTVLSIDKARQEKSWRLLQEQYDKNEIIQAQVTNYNKGGLLVNLDGVRGFVPASQVTRFAAVMTPRSRPIWPGWSVRRSR